jgi:hypothetical protein
MKPTRYEIEAERSFLEGWFLSDINFCDTLIDIFDNGETEPGVVHTSNYGEKKVEKDFKDSYDMNLSNSTPEYWNYVNLLQEILMEYLKVYEGANNVQRFEVEQVNLQKYNPGQGFHAWHTERLSSGWDSARHLVFMTYLNDVEDGGETEFMYQNVKVKPQKGLTLIWPVDWTHTHRGITSLTNTKYIATGWYRFV